MKKTIIDKNGSSNTFNKNDVENIKSMETRIIIYLKSGSYLTILGCQNEKESLLEQLQDETTSEIHTQCAVKFVPVNTKK